MPIKIDEHLVFKMERLLKRINEAELPSNTGLTGYLSLLEKYDAMDKQKGLYKYFEPLNITDDINEESLEVIDENIDELDDNNNDHPEDQNIDNILNSKDDEKDHILNDKVQEKQQVLGQKEVHQKQKCDQQRNEKN